MSGGLTHASFFSGVGGTDLGLERAGFRTVSFSEIDPYASAVLAERWPEIPNLGDITTLVDGGRGGQPAEPTGVVAERDGGIGRASLWSGGFPCQDLSIAGKRAGFDGERSVLAFAFLALVERHRPPAILLENVPGLLSSNNGRDMARLVGEMVELGYGVAYRILDAQHFGVPQRRRRVFILGLRSDPDDVDGRVAAERAAAVLSVGSRCERHPATGHQKGARTAEGTPRGTIGTVPAALGHHGYTLGQEALSDGFLQLSPSPDPNGVRAADGLAGRSHDSEVASPWVTSGGEMIDASGYHDVTPTLNGYSVPMGGLDVGAYNQRDRIYGDQAPSLDAHAHSAGDAPLTWVDGSVEDDPLLPLGLDSHRYRCCGNGVVAPVAEWLGNRIAAALR